MNSAGFFGYGLVGDVRHGAQNGRESNKESR